MARSPVRKLGGVGEGGAEEDVVDACLEDDDGGAKGGEVDEAAAWNEVAAGHRGDGDAHEAATGGALVVLGVHEPPREEVSAEQAQTVLSHTTRSQSLQDATEIFTGIGVALGASLENTEPGCGS